MIELSENKLIPLCIVSTPRWDRVDIVLSCGRREFLSEEQLKTIRWLHYLGVRSRMKKNNVRLYLQGFTGHRYGRVVDILAKESIPFTIEQDSRDS